MKTMLRLFVMLVMAVFHCLQKPYFLLESWGLITTLEEDGSSKSVFGNMHFPKNIKRSDRVLVEVVKTLGEKASGTCAKLVIDSIDKGTAYRITDIDGDETIEFLDNYEWEIAL